MASAMRTCLSTASRAAALAFIISVSPLAVQAGGGSEESSGRQLSTKSGKIYYDYRVAQVDPNGIYIWHRKGMAKIHFSNLSRSVQQQFGYNPSAARAFEEKYTKPSTALVAQTVGGKGTDAASGVIWTVRTRTTLPRALTRAGCSMAWSGYPALWLPHPEAYARFPWRQLAEYDFLLTTGIVPRPAGVRTWYF